MDWATIIFSSAAEKCNIKSFYENVCQTQETQQTGYGLKLV